MNLKLMLEEAASRYGEKTAIVLGNRRLSYTELDEASNKVANVLTEIGVNKGDRVAILLANSPEYVATYFGIAKTGAIAAPLDTKYKLDELSSLFNDFLPKVLVTESPTMEPLIPVLSRFESIRHVIDLSSNDEGQFLSYQVREDPLYIIRRSPGVRIPVVQLVRLLGIYGKDQPPPQAPHLYILYVKRWAILVVDDQTEIARGTLGVNNIKVLPTKLGGIIGIYTGP